MKKLIMVTAIMLLLGCESSPVRRAQMIEEHPEWDSAIVKIIKEGYLLKGMTADQVKASWGRPCLSCTGTVMDKEWEKWRSWEYQTQIVFFDKNERVDRWEKK